MDFINTRHTKQSEKVNLILLYPDKNQQQHQNDTVFSIGCVRHTQSSLSCKFLVFEGYLNFCPLLCFRNYILDNTLDNGTPDGYNDFDDNNDDDNNSHNSDGNNDDK